MANLSWSPFAWVETCIVLELGCQDEPVAGAEKSKKTIHQIAIAIPCGYSVKGHML
jgi:hypothetical protein